MKAQRSTLIRRAAGAFAVAAAACAAPAGAADGAALAKTQGCLKCHSLERQKVGPPFRDIAAKYRGDAEAARKLTAFLRLNPDHARAGAAEADLRALADYVLSVK